MHAYLLAGGRSSRMGRPKIDVPFGGSTFGAIVAGAAKPVFDEIICVQRSGGAPMANLETIYEAEHPDTAPIFGVACALEHAGSECFILAIDYPLITTGVLRYLRDRFTASGAPMLVPMWRGRAQMLCAGYSASLLPMVNARIEQGRFDLRGLIEASGALVVAEDELRARFDGEPLMNVNTPAELEEAESVYVRS